MDYKMGKHSVTDKQFYLDPKLKEKMDLCIDRCTGKRKLDNLIIIDGDEGFGKTTLAVSLAYYVHHETKRPFDVNHIFFDLEKLINFAKSTEDQIIIWDEAALGGLSTQWHSKKQQKLIQLLMVARKKRHFFIFNIPKFFKLAEYILVDRAICLVHVYARHELELGRFCYFKKKSKELLYYDRIRSKARNYNKFMDFWGTFSNALPKLIDEDAYDKKKDKAIMSIGEDDTKVSKWKGRYDELCIKLGKCNIEKKVLSECLDIPINTLYDWAKKGDKSPNLLGE